VIKRLIIGVAVVVLVLVGVGVFVRRGAVGDEPPLNADTRRATVARGELSVSVSATGSIVPRRAADLTFDVPGRVSRVKVKTGDNVQADATLVQLDDALLTWRVHQAQVGVAAAQARLDQLLADPRPEEVAAAEADLNASQATVWNAAEQRDQVSAGATQAEIAAARAEVAAATSRQKMAQIAHDMTLKCETFTSPGGEQQEFCPGLGVPEEQARFELHAADEELAATQVRLDQLLAGPPEQQIDAARAGVSEAAARRDAAQAQLDLLLAGASAHQIALSQAEVDQAQAELEIARVELGKTTLVAPFDGLVTAVNVRAGEMAPAALPTVALADVSQLQIVVNVDEIDVTRIAEGQKATITVDALPGEPVSGTVKRIAPAADQTSNLVVFEVTIVLDETDLPLRLGMSATAAIVIEHLQDVLLVPNWAIRRDWETGRTFVKVLRGEAAEEVPVEIGVRGRDVSQVTSGLEAGDVVVAGELRSVRDLLNEVE
jgi:HlyD family secretion protein